MFRVKDFSMMDVINVSGKKIGFVKDILLNINEGKVVGFSLSPFNLFIRNLTVLSEDIISFNEVMIVRETCKVSSLSFKSLKDMDIIDHCGNMVGMFEDIIFDEHFELKGILISSGVIRKFFKGKNIALINEIIVGEENILYFSKHQKYNFRSISHNLIGVDCYEEN